MTPGASTRPKSRLRFLNRILPARNPEPTQPSLAFSTSSNPTLSASTSSTPEVASSSSLFQIDPEVPPASPASQSVPIASPPASSVLGQYLLEEALKCLERQERETIREFIST